MRIDKFLTIATVSLLFGWVAACGDASKKTAESDEDIETAITAQIESHPRLRAYDIDVDADAERNHVKLSGTVPTQDLRLEAVQVAKEGRADRVVEDEIKVDPSDIAQSDYTEAMAREAREGASRTGDKLGDNIADAWIHTKVRSKLATEGELPFGGLNVDVADNVVTLRGTVETPQAKLEAQRIAQQTGGVEEVRNQLVVKATK